eukprot:9166124-Lingulodinium_polyedra.AAC.1
MASPVLMSRKRLREGDLQGDVLELGLLLGALKLLLHRLQGRPLRCLRLLLGLHRLARHVHRAFSL